MHFDDAPISERTLAYFRRHLRHEIYEQIVRAFYRQAADQRIKLTKAKLARRLGKDKGRIAKLLGFPRNLTLDTISDLLVGMGIDPRAPFAALVEQQDREDQQAAIVTQQQLPTISPSANEALAVAEANINRALGLLLRKQPPATLQEQNLMLLTKAEHEAQRNVADDFVAKYQANKGTARAA